MQFAYPIKQLPFPNLETNFVEYSQQIAKSLRSKFFSYSYCESQQHKEAQPFSSRTTCRNYTSSVQNYTALVIYSTPNAVTRLPNWKSIITQSPKLTVFKFMYTIDSYSYLQSCFFIINLAVYFFVVTRNPNFRWFCLH